MAGKIQLLSDEVIGKIAAGEVVERPAAAIKELVENSLDAGASAVTVEIRDGGISYFRVTDNGSGIRSEDIRMAFERHATSKIRRTDDLFSIQTLGFRGEALASIAAVARVTCTTRTKADQSGIKVQNNGGTIESIEEAACPEGTTFVVRDLFFNTPVRLKFLKKPVTEAGYVSDLMMRLILSRPDVSFRYISQGKTLYHSAGDGKLSSAVFSIYGREMLRSMHEVDIERLRRRGRKRARQPKPPVVLHQWAIYEVVDFVRGGGSGVPGARIVRQVPDVRAASDHAV